MVRSMNVKSLNPHITCVLCGGYLVDATTIIECLHSFCRSCIIYWLDRSYKCPVCETEIHKTRPYLNIRPDRVLQDIVYKLIPGLYDCELRRRKEFNADVEKEEQIRSGIEDNGHDENEDENKDKKDDIEDPVCVTLEYYGKKRFWQEKTIFPTRYLRCSSKLPVKVLKKFVSTKFGIPDTHFVEIVRSDEILSDHLSLRELWRVYGLHNKSFIDLQYIIIDKNLDSTISKAGLDEPKFKKIIRKRKRKRKAPIVGSSTEPTGMTPIKRRRRKRLLLVAKRNVKPSSTQGGGVDGTTNGEQQLDKVSDQIEVDQTVRDNDIASTENNKNDHPEQNLDKLIQNDIKTDKYACPATPESDADHNDCVSPTVSQDSKQVDIVPPS